jgi:transposase-like protein
MAETKKIPCPACGAAMRNEKALLVCDYCKSERTLELSPAAIAYEPFGPKEPKLHPEERFECTSCGATFEEERDFRAGACPYCKSALYTPLGQNTTPYAIPFAVDSKEAFELLRKKIGSMWFAPNDFKKFFKAYRIASHLFPAWIFRFRVRARYTGQRGVDYIVRRTVYTDRGPQVVHEVRTRWYPVRGVVDLGFSDVYAPANKKFPPLAAKLRFDPGQALEHTDELLPGHDARLPTSSSKEGFAAAQAVVEPAIRATIRADIGGDRQMISTIERDFYDVGESALNLPLYWGRVEYRGKFYDFFVNGQSGEVIAERPYSWIKIFFAVFAALAAIAATLFALDQLGYIDLDLPDRLLY